MVKSVAIIGGGLAGLTLSIQLAKKGVPVLVFEKEQYPYHKVCGEYIAMESWKYLESCGMPLSSMDLPRIAQLKVSAPNGRFLTHALNPGGFGISRYTLDGTLADIANREGVQLLTGTKVEEVAFDGDSFHVKTNTKSYETALVVGSYGKRSNLDVKLQRSFISKALPPSRNYVGVKYHVRVQGFDARHIELHNFKNGYCGISKVEGDRYCLCYLTTAQTLQESGSIKEMESRVLMQNPFLKKYFTEAEFLYEAPLVISQINFENKSVVEDHILMAGDAAGLITPLCGNGMSMALHASKMLSELVFSFLKGQLTRTEMENLYQKRWSKQFSTRVAVGRLIQYSFGREVLTNWMVGGLRQFPSLVAKLEGLTHGEPF